MPVPTNSASTAGEKPGSLFIVPLTIGWKRKEMSTQGLRSLYAGRSPGGESTYHDGERGPTGHTSYTGHERSMSLPLPNLFMSYSVRGLTNSHRRIYGNLSESMRPLISQLKFPEAFWRISINLSYLNSKSWFQSRKARHLVFSRRRWWINFFG